MAAHENDLPLSVITLSPEQIFLSTRIGSWLNVFKQPDPGKCQKIGEKNQLGELDQRIFLPEQSAEQPRFFALVNDGDFLRLTPEGVRFISKCADKSGLAVADTYL